MSFFSNNNNDDDDDDNDSSNDSFFLIRPCIAQISRFQTKMDQTYTAWTGDTCISYKREYLISQAGEKHGISKA